MVQNSDRNWELILILCHNNAEMHKKMNMKNIQMQKCSH